MMFVVMLAGIVIVGRIVDRVGKMLIFSIF